MIKYRKIMCGGTVNTRSHALAVWIIGGVPPVSLSSMFSNIMYVALNLMMMTDEVRMNIR